jgi:hypothetical protein
MMILTHGAGRGNSIVALALRVMPPHAEREDYYGAAIAVTLQSIPLHYLDLFVLS